MAFDRLKRLLRSKQPARRAGHESYRDIPAETAKPPTKSEQPRAVKRAAQPRPGRFPVKARQKLQREAVAALVKEIKKNPKRHPTDRLTLLEIAERFLSNEYGVTRPSSLRAYDVFRMFIRPSARQRQGVSGPCHLWQGAENKGKPVVTTINAQKRARLKTDARTYIIENPPKGRRRRLRTVPENICGNALCVNPRHVRLVSLNPLSHQGENHPRSKFSDRDIVRMVRDYNSGLTSREVGKKFKVHWTYVEQIMRKEKRTEATEGLTIRGRFGSR